MTQISLLKAALSVAAIVGYLDAKADLTQDIRILTGAVHAHITIARAERKGTLNFFFFLEDRALSPKSASCVFLIFEGRTWTYKQAYETVLKYGSWLKDRHGVKKDEVVAIDFINKPQFLWLFFGLWSIGAKVALVNYHLAGTALIHAVRVAKARLVIIDSEVAGNVLGGDEGEKTRQRLASEDVQGEPFEEREVLVFDEGVERVVDTWTGRRESNEYIGVRVIGEMGALVYTSGTTGLPKAANIPYSKFLMSSSFVGCYLRIKPGDVFYTCMPLYHSSALLLGAAVCIGSGATFSLGRRFSNKTFWPEVKASKATIIQYVGETCRYLLAAPRPADPAEDHKHCVRIAFGNGLRPEIWQQFRERFNIPVIAEFYGQTEGNMASWNYNTGPHGQGAIGRAGWLLKLLIGRKHQTVKLDYDTELPLRDPTTGLCIRADYNEPGELIWQADPDNTQAVFQGYFNNPAASEKKLLRDVFRKGDAWFRTGDVTRNDSNGFSYFVDRLGDTYRWKSENVSTNEVADALESHPSVHECNVYGIALPNHDGRAGCAAIKLAPGVGGEQFMREFGVWAKRVMPRFKVPVFVRTMEKMELTGTNKYVKTSLRAEGADPDNVGLVHDAGKAEAGQAQGHGEGGKWVGREMERLWWLGGGEGVDGYVPFRKRDWDGLVAGKTKL